MNEFGQADDLCTSLKKFTTPRNVALQRIRYDGLLSLHVLRALIELFEKFRLIPWRDEALVLQKCDGDLNCIHALKHMTQILKIHVALARNDETLAEEMGVGGGNVLYKQIIAWYQKNCEDIPESHVLSDPLCEVHDLAFEAALHCTVSRSTRMMEEVDLKNRLPLVFHIDSCKCNDNDGDSSDVQSVLIQQVQARQSAQDDVGFVMWPSAVILAKWIANNRERFAGKDIIEIGAGCGLTGLAAALTTQCRSIVLTDFNDVVLQNLLRNIKLNGFNHVCSAEKLDFYAQDGNSECGWLDRSGVRCRQVDYVIAADIICKPDDAVAAAKTCFDALKCGGEAFIICADSKHRYGVDIFERECRKLGIQVYVQDVKELGTCGDNVNKGLHLTAGYVEGMCLEFFHLQKPHLSCGM